VIIADPWPPQLPWYYDRWYGYRHWFHPAPFHYFPTEHVLPGGYVHVVRSVAIRFEGAETLPNAPR
jgi:hypothetical protein